MSGRPLHVLMASSDRKWLRHLSRFLQDFGYAAHATSDAQGCLAAANALEPSLIIIDQGLAPHGGVEVCRMLRDRATTRPAFTFLAVEQPSQDDVLEALEAGADDFLSKRIVYGEYLARLRSAARMLELWRRDARQRGRDAATGLRNREACTEYLHALDDGHSAREGLVACVLIDIDHFARVNYVYGRLAGDAILREVAERAETLAGDDATVFNLGLDRFAAVLSGRSDVEAAEWAEGVRRQIEATEFHAGEAHVRLTVSIGVTAGPVGSRTSEELLEQAHQALTAAKRSGRNCVARIGEFVSEQKMWDELAAPGKLFETTTARDVMTVSTVTVRSDDTTMTATTLRQRSAAEVIPVTDAAGQMVGALIFDGEHANPRSSTPTAKVREVMNTSIRRFPTDASLSSLLDYFGRETSPAAVIVADNRAVGYVTRDGLAALIRPVTSHTFHAGRLYQSTTDYLVVADAASER